MAAIKLQNIKNAAILQPLDPKTFLSCQHFHLALTISKMYYRKEHVSIKKSRGPNYLKPLKGPGTPNHGQKSLVEFCLYNPQKLSLTYDS